MLKSLISLDDQKSALENNMQIPSKPISKFSIQMNKTSQPLTLTPVYLYMKVSGRREKTQMKKAPMPVMSEKMCKKLVGPRKGNMDGAKNRCRKERMT